ncbi:MAG: hypothetical protein ABIY40_09070, partial [Rhodanobacteraceae bacterium]
GALPRSHVLILCNEEDGVAWVRTRGLRKFARPDISLRGVPPVDIDRAGELAERLVELEVMGMRFADGTALDVEGVPRGLVAKLGGTLDDPQFNNTHVEFNWPAT